MSMLVMTLAGWVRDATCITSVKARHVVHALVKFQLAIVWPVVMPAMAKISENTFAWNSALLHQPRQQVLGVINEYIATSRAVRELVQARVYQC